MAIRKLANKHLILQWRQAWKLTSVWVFLIIGALPDIYNGVVAAGLHDELPEPAKNCLRVLAILGIAFRLIKQNAIAQHVVKDDEQRPNH